MADPEQVAEQQAGESEPVNSGQGGRKTFIVAGKTAKAGQPGEGSLDDPATEQQHEAALACRTGPDGEALLSNATLLHNLELPKIDDLPDADFVAIRMQADDFSEFRAALSRVLRRTSASQTRGKPLQEAFAENLDEIRWRSELLRRDTRDKSLKRFLQGGFQGITLSAVTSTAAAAAADLTGQGFRPAALAARFLTSMGLATLLAALFHKTPTGKSRLLRFYEVLLDAR